MSDTQLYRQAGNSIVVNVLQELLYNLTSYNKGTATSFVAIPFLFIFLSIVFISKVIYQYQE